ncbi:hypothetical protein QJS66_19090 [Kocuria rhizophila]|nr:hypothetical protein QJS66_19090 [Kocuria rhizophila]
MATAKTSRAPRRTAASKGPGADGHRAGARTWRALGLDGRPGPADGAGGRRLLATGYRGEGCGAGRDRRLGPMECDLGHQLRRSPGRTTHVRRGPARSPHGRGPAARLAISPAPADSSSRLVQRSAHPRHPVYPFHRGTGR